MTRLTILVSALALGGLASATQLTSTPVLASANPVAAQQQANQMHHPTAPEEAEMQMQEAHTMEMHQKMMANMKAMKPTRGSVELPRPSGSTHELL
jgi:altronate dehydratase